MPVNFFNFEFSYDNSKGKPVFVPSKDGRAVGASAKKLVEKLHDFPAYYRHLRKGGHVAALHDHRRRKFFAKVDLANFFYTVHRNRVQRCLGEIGVDAARHFAKWSTVKCPYGTGLYVLPYGFVQSPILATLVMDRSSLGQHLGNLPEAIFVSVYIDDITISSDDESLLKAEFDELMAQIEASGFVANAAKTCAPTDRLEVFNCELRNSSTSVLEKRVEEFYSVDRSPEGYVSFEQYCAAVVAGNN